MRSHEKWVVAVISTGLVATLAWLAVENYRLINARIEQQAVAIEALNTSVAAHDRELAAQRVNNGYIAETLKRIEAKVDGLSRR